MCWSGEASATLAAAGFAGTVYFYRKGEPKPLCAALGYFAGMEALQAYTYSVIDQCAAPENQMATLLGYLHIAFQPFFVNAVSLHFIPQQVRERIQGWVYSACFLGALLFLIRLYPFEWEPWCYDSQRVLMFYRNWTFQVPLCGEALCSYSGDWHIAWEVPAKAFVAFENFFICTYFVLPVLYGSWRMTLYHLVSGPLLALLTTNNANEWAAVWCLYSIGLLAVTVKSPLRKHLYVKRWFWWSWLRSRTS